MLVMAHHAPVCTQNGIMLFPDYVKLNKARLQAEVLPEVCVGYGRMSRAFGGRELDSSCVVLDKVANWDALAVAVAMNGDLQQETYHSLLGDKDTWGLAMLHVGKTVSMGELEPGYLLIEHAKVREGEG